MRVSSRSCRAEESDAQLLKAVTLLISILTTRLPLQTGGDEDARHTFVFSGAERILFTCVFHS